FRNTRNASDTSGFRVENGAMDLVNIVPSPGHAVDWAAIVAVLGDHVAAMADCAQDPRHHPEGDVWTHTRMVVEELLELDAFRSLPEEERFALFWAALLHDIGKPVTMRMDGEAIVTPNHAAVGA